LRKHIILISESVFLRTSAYAKAGPWKIQRHPQCTNKGLTKKSSNTDATKTNMKTKLVIPE